MIKNLKKVISTFAAVALLASSASAFAVSFPDVDANASYAGAVDALTTLGVVNGDDNGKFNPENTVTRAEFAKMVVEALGAGKSASSSTYTKFTDAQGHWAAGYIEIGVAKGFINGYDDTTFGPDDQVTYAQAVKMLVGAIGYETYASQQGGYPSGYLSYGSSLDIVNGVTGVANDTALTRAQCAVLIYNTLKAPICKINGYEQNYKGEWVPKYEEMDGEGKNWQSLLTSEHNAYVVKGRVMDVTRDAKDGDTVKFRVELADNFDGEKVKGSEDNSGIVSGCVELPEVFVGTSGADKMQWVYSEAIIQEDVDTGDYTIVAITPYGSAKTVEFAAKDVKTVLNSNNEIEVKKESSAKTNDYDVTGATLYINGESEGEYDTIGVLAKATAVMGDNNVSGTVTLVKATKVASTSTGDAYNYVMVDYYLTGKVTSVDIDEDEAAITVSELNSSGIDGEIVIDLEEDMEQSVKFYKDGAEISYDAVKKDDIVSVACKYGTSNWEAEDMEVYVSDATVSGTVTGKNTTKKTITVDGETYDIAGGSYTVGTNYTLYIDAFGYVVDQDVNASSKTLGIVIGKYNTAGQRTIKLITADGEVKSYPATATEYDNFNDPNATTTMTAADVKNNIVEYKIDNSGNIKLKGYVTSSDIVDMTGSKKAEFSKELSMLDGYSISETATKIVALDDEFVDGKASAMTLAQLEDEGEYEVLLTNDNGDGVYGLVIITGDLAALRPTSTLAVVQASGTETEVSDTACEIVTVAVNGEKDVDVYFEQNSTSPLTLAEGDIIMYTVGTEGYVEKDDYKVVYKAADTYDDMVDNVKNADADKEFASKLKDPVVETSLGSNEYTLNINSTTDDDVEIYYGPVYTASANSVRLFKSQAAGNKLSFNNVKAFSLGTANVYTYNYNKAEDDNARVSVAGLSQDNSFFNLTSGNEFEWNSTTRVNPRVAFVRVVDNVVTDIVYYRAK